MTAETSSPPVDPKSVVVIGGGGFVGSAVVNALERSRHHVRVAHAPRILAAPKSEGAAIELAVSSPEIEPMARQLAGADVVINAAGVADATASSPAELFGANTVLPRVAREAAVAGGAQRFVHISSAGVQGRSKLLDESLRTQPFSPYTVSKAWGEATLHSCEETVIFRPTSVHGAARAVTRSLTRLARSPFASVAGDGSLPSPQVRVENVGASIAFVATTAQHPPGVVLQPSEGLTTEELLRLLGANRVVHVPTFAAQWIVWLLFGISSAVSPLRAHARRVEMLWFGQPQVIGWLDRVGWRPDLDRESWRDLAGANRASA